MAGKRSYGTGELYEKHGAYYGRWRTSDGRKLNRKVGAVRTPGSADGLTRAQAERAFRKMQEAEERRPSRRRELEPVTVGAAATSLRRAKALEGARKSYLEDLESMQRVHLEPNIGALALEKVSTEQIEALAGAMLDGGLAPKTVRNVLTFTHSVFEHAIANGWCHENPVRYAARPKRRRAARRAAPTCSSSPSPSSTPSCARYPTRSSIAQPAPTRRGRNGPGAAAPARRARARCSGSLILAAAMTGLRQSELLGLRWRDVDWTAQRIRVSNTFVRGEHSAEGKSDLSTRRSVPMADSARR